MLASAAIVSVACARPVAAQVVVGRVVMPDSATAVAGALVTATDARGTTVGRGLTSGRGDFVVRLAAAGSVRLSVRRIGYRPVTGPTVRVDAQTSDRVLIVWEGQPITIAATGVRERETCRIAADSGLLVARLWEEARTAMLTSTVSAEGPPLFAEWIEYDRLLDSTSRTVRQQRVKTSRSPTTHAFRSLPAEVLREKGFVVLEDGSTMYYAPDADVLLSDVFVSGHCFHLVDAPASEPGVIGVGFVPSRDRRDMREIEGTLWIDRPTSELRRLEYRYVNLPDAAEAAEPGGVVEFRRLADGNWFVNRWHVRMPRLGARDRSTDNGLRRTVMSVNPIILRGVQVTGGEVTRALRGDSMVYQATGPSISVQVVFQDALMDAAGATLTLEGTDYAGHADAAGRIRLSPVLAGRYRASLQTPKMQVLGMAPVTRELETSTDTRTDSLMLPSASQALALACPRDSIQEGEGMLHGTVRDEGARPVAGRTVTVTWVTAFTIVGASRGDQLQYSERTLSARTDGGGRWKMCGVPRTAVMTATVFADSGFDRQRVRLNDQPFGTVDLVVHRPPAESREIAATLPSRVRALVEFVVTDDRGAALTEAQLEVTASGASTRTVVTGPSGTALVPDVAYGRVSVRARRVGFAPGGVTFTVDGERVSVTLVMSGVRAPMLDTMRVVGARAVSARLAGFEARRAAKQATVSITREEIEQRNPTDIWEMLTNIPSVKVADRDDMVVATSARAMISRFDNEPCYLRLMVDGVLVMADPKGKLDLRQLPRPNEIHGVEVFNGPASIPLEYGGLGSSTWCGLIAIWTR